MRRRLIPLLAPAAALLAGCVTVPGDAGFSEVAAVAKNRTGFALAWTRGADADAAADAITRALLGGDLSVDRAVQVALLNNRTLQANFENLGIARGQLIQASLFANPVFGFDIWAFGGGTTFEGLLSEDLTSIIYRPLRVGMRRGESEATKRQVAAQVVTLIADVRRAFYRYQADKQLVEMFGRAVQATEASYRTAARMREAGGIRQLDVLQERALYEQAKVDLNAAVENLSQSREALNALMGLWGEMLSWRTPDRLPELPASESARADGLAGPPTVADLTGDQPSTRATPPASPEQFAGVERAAVANNLDLGAARSFIMAQASRLKLDVALAVVPFADVGLDSDKERNESNWGLGPGGAVKLPMFDWGQGAYPREASRLRQRVEEYAALATNIRAAARAAEARLQTTRARAAYYRNVILPLRAAITAESQLQYNAMQVGQFDLMLAKRLQIQAGAMYVSALRDYWVARSDLQQILDGSIPATVAQGPAMPGFAPVNTGGMGQGTGGLNNTGGN